MILDLIGGLAILAMLGLAGANVYLGYRIAGWLRDRRDRKRS